MIDEVADGVVVGLNLLFDIGDGVDAVIDVELIGFDIASGGFLNLEEVGLFVEVVSDAVGDVGAVLVEVAGGGSEGGGDVVVVGFTSGAVDALGDVADSIIGQLFIEAVGKKGAGGAA